MNWKDYKVDTPEGTAGIWSVERFEAPKFSIESLRIARDGRIPPPPGTYTRLCREGTGVIMSDTPAEIEDLRSFWRAVRDPQSARILMHGLGLGVALKIALSFSHVKHVDVVEQSEDVLNLVGKHIRDERVTIHHADAYTHRFPKDSKWNIAWHDIWDNLCTDNFEGMSKLHRRYARKVAWQESWSRQWLKAHQSRYR